LDASEKFESRFREQIELAIAAEDEMLTGANEYLASVLAASPERVHRRLIVLACDMASAFGIDIDLILDYERPRRARRSARDNREGHSVLKS
jgi:type IV secretory pathway ATPase VirB11/archaellum biosynthesis ATPase